MRNKYIITTVIMILVFGPFIALKYAFLPVTNISDAPSVSITITPGTSVHSAATQLKSNGLIRNVNAFLLYSRFTGMDKKMKSGTYELSPSMPLENIVRILTTGGSSSTSCFTIPEGSTLKKIAEILQSEGYAHANNFVDAAENAEIAYSHGITSESLEGYLFPDTYCAGTDSNERLLIGMMLKEFGKKLPADINETSEALGLTLHKVITLASIIEKEASDKDERRLVSAVFHNRLKAGMPLQSCASVIYAMGDFYDGNLHKTDMEIDSPYNTYLHNGLPPGPISNPGIDSIIAALHPAEADYLYFVSTNNGNHIFSSSYDEHLATVHQYQSE